MLQSLRVLRTFDAEPVVLLFIGPVTAIYGGLILQAHTGAVADLIPLPWYPIGMLIVGGLAVAGVDHGSRPLTLLGIAGSFFALGWLSIRVIQLPGPSALTIALFLPLMVASAWAFLRILLDPMRSWAISPRNDGGSVDHG